MAKEANHEGQWAKKALDRIKRNPLLSLLILLGSFLIGLSSFTDATKNLLGLFTKDRVVDVTGTWTSDVLTNPFNHTDTSRLIFRFERNGNALQGTVRETATDKSYTYVREILGGVIDGKRVSFRRPDTVNSIDANGEPIQQNYNDFFSGEFSGNELHLTWESDRSGGFPVQTFIARRQ